MRHKPTKRHTFLLILILFCVLCASIFGYSQYQIYVAKEEFTEIMRIVDEDVPPLMCQSFAENPVILDVEVSINSSVVEEKYHDWYSWVEDCVVIFHLSDDFDDFTRREQYEFIDDYGDNIYSVKNKAISQLAPNHGRYGSFLSEENEMLKRIYGKTVFTESNYDVYFKTSNNTYEYCSVDDLMNVNGKEIWVHSDPTNYATDAPYVGMDASSITYTKLGRYSEAEKCLDYYALRPERRSITYIWRDSNGELLFKAYALNGEVISTTDFRGGKIVSHGPDEKYK